MPQQAAAAQHHAAGTEDDDKLHERDPQIETGDRRQDALRLAILPANGGLLREEDRQGWPESLSNQERVDESRNGVQMPGHAPP